MLLLLLCAHDSLVNLFQIFIGQNLLGVIGVVEVVGVVEVDEVVDVGRSGR